MADMVERMRSAGGERNGCARLTAEQLKEIRLLSEDFDLAGNLSFVARGYGVSRDTVRLIVNGTTWRQLP